MTPSVAFIDQCLDGLRIYVMYRQRMAERDLNVTAFHQRNRPQY